MIRRVRQGLSLLVYIYIYVIFSFKGLLFFNDSSLCGLATGKTHGRHRSIDDTPRDLIQFILANSSLMRSGSLRNMLKMSTDLYMYT